MTGDTKLCPRCGGTKPLAEFGPNRSRVDGLDVYCRPCATARAREWRLAHLSEYDAYQREYRRKLQAKVTARRAKWFAAHSVDKE